MDALKRASYRGKDIKTGEWREGSLITVCNGETLKRYPCIVISYNHDTFDWHEVDLSTVGQFTGLCDKNGKEIFEGDVIFNSNRTLITMKEDPRTYVVQFQEGKYSEEGNWLQNKPSFIFKKIQLGNMKFMELIFSQQQIEIIGNIHDNQELLP